MNDPSLPRVYKSDLMRDVEAMFAGRDIRLVLIDLFEQHGSFGAVARRLGLSKTTIRVWINALGLVTEQRTRARLELPYE